MCVCVCVCVHVRVHVCVCVSSRVLTPKGVPVPCSERTLTWLGDRCAQVRAWRSTSCTGWGWWGAGGQMELIYNTFLSCEVRQEVQSTYSQGGTSKLEINPAEIVGKLGPHLNQPLALGGTG